MPRTASILAAGLTAALLTSSFVMAAEPPDALTELPKIVMGVVTTGDQISLRLKEDGQERTLKIGEAYRDGWSLSRLTDTLAVMAKDGQTRSVGLNPAGAVAAPVTSGGARVVLISEGFASFMAKAQERIRTAAAGQTLEETQWASAVSEYTRQRVTDSTLAAVARGEPSTAGALLYKNILDEIGADPAKLLELQNRQAAARYASALEAYNRVGTVTVRIPPQTGEVAILAAAGMTGPTLSLQRSARDADGAYTITSVPPMAGRATAQTELPRYISYDPTTGTTILAPSPVAGIGRVAVPPPRQPTQ